MGLDIKNLVVVICHYQEDLSWTKDLEHPYVVYNKNYKEAHKYAMNLPNVGFDSIAYFKYIIDMYEFLPNYVCFSQDDPFFHCHYFIGCL